MSVTMPSLSSNTTGIVSATGVGSGLDVASIVSQLMTVEQQPLTLLSQQEAADQAKLTSLGTVKGALSALQSAAQALSSASTAAYTATASDSSVLTGSADSTAIAGSYSVGVTQLAQQQKLIAAGTTSTSTAIGSGTSTTLTFQMGTISGGTLTNGIYSGASFTADATQSPVSVTIDSSNNTLAGIRDAINAANTGVTASIINDGSSSPYRLVLTSNNTGATSSLQLSVSGDSTISSLLSYDPSTTTQNLTQLEAAQNAQLSVDGVTINSSSNTVSDAIQGVTLNLLSQTTVANPTVTLTVASDNSALTSALNSLVQAYNSSNSTIGSATAKGATLQGDYGVISLQNRIREILGGVQVSSGTITDLSQLGITFQSDGSLAVDSTKLNAALASDSGAVATLTAAIGSAISSAATDILGTSGPIAAETDGINASITAIGNQTTQINAHLAEVQAQYQAQFSALDALMAGMNATSTFLTQQLANLPGWTSNNNSKG